MNTIDAQCESQLFMKQLDKIKEKGELDIAKAGEYAVALDSHQVLVIGTKQSEVTVTFKTNNGVDHFAFPTRAITMITTPRSRACNAHTTQYEWNSDYTIESKVESRTSSHDISFALLFNSTRNAVDTALYKLKSKSRKIISLTDISSEIITLDNLKINNYYQNVYISVLVILILTAVATLILLCRIKSPKLQNNFS